MGSIFRAVIIGAPGSGKGTVSSRIKSIFGLKHLSSGDLLRSQIMKGSEVGQEAKKYIDEGHLVPNHVMIELILKELEEIGPPGYLLDGFPRTQYQAEILNDEHLIDAALCLHVPFDEIVSRIKDRWLHLPSGRIYNLSFNPPKVPGRDDVTGEELVQRDDDKPESVLKRLEVYAANTRPVVDFYRQKGTLIEFHGRETNKIWPHVEKFLESVIPPQSQKNES